MKIIFKYFTLILIVGFTGLLGSCGDDEIENLTLKRVGNIKVTVLDGDQPVANTEVKIYNGQSDNLVSVASTNEAGVIEFPEMLEGSYSLQVEINEPSYRRIYQEFQIVSGESKEETLQAREFVGSLSVLLVDGNEEKIIKEDLKIGLAVVPRNIAFEKAITNKEKIGLATQIQYFEGKGEINFDSIPSGTYAIFRVKSDTIEIDNEVIQYLYVKRAGQDVKKLYVDLKSERIFSKENWEVASVSELESEAAITGFPVTSFRFFRSKTGYKFEMFMNNGVEFTGNFGLYSDGDFYFDGVTSSDPDYYLSISPEALIFNENGELKMEVSRFRVYNESGTVDFDFDDLRIGLR